MRLTERTEGNCSILSGCPVFGLNEKTGDAYAAESVLWRRNTTLVWVPFLGAVDCASANTYVYLIIS